VDIENPDFERFPKFKNAKSVETLLNPGDVLFLPPYWFHHVIAVDFSTSVNFWYVMNNDSKENVTLPLKKQSQIMAFRRNVEKFIGDAIGHGNVGQFLEEMYSGRFDDIPQLK